MKVLFMGTPEFAAECLEMIADCGEFTVVGAVSQPDKPKGRGHKLQPTPVKTAAENRKIPVFQPVSLKNNAFLDELAALSPDIIVVVAYGRILPKYVLDFPKYGCVNVHASLLPKYRGAAPIQRCIIDGEKTTGVTTMYMEQGLDTGDMIFKSETEIGEYETAGELSKRLSKMGSELIVKTLRAIAEGDAPREKQNDELSNYAEMLSKDTGKIDWQKSHNEIINLIYGTNPWPVAYTMCGDNVMKIYDAHFGKDAVNSSPGEVISAGKSGIEVCCGDGVSIIIKELQFKGGKRMAAASYLNGHSIDIGTVLK